jgi:hypothetical protein
MQLISDPMFLLAGILLAIGLGLILAGTYNVKNH